MQVHYDEGVAIYIGPEPCVGVREDGDEASVGEGIAIEPRKPLKDEFAAARRQIEALAQHASGPNLAQVFLANGLKDGLAWICAAL